MSVVYLTCITVCRNDRDALMRTMASIKDQTRRPNEIIIVDGASSDGTADALHALQLQFTEIGVAFNYISEPDSGIYNAMNKGIALASEKAGGWTIFMNAGDLFASTDVIEKTIPYLSRDRADVVYGDYVTDHDGKEISVKAHELETIGRWVLTCHQAIFTRTQMLKSRPYNELYRITADYEWYLNCYQQGGIFVYVPFDICIYDRSGISSTEIYQGFMDIMNIRKEHGTQDVWIIFKIKQVIIYIYDRAVKILA